MGSGITKVTVEKVLEDGSWILDTGYHVPAKRRTPEEVAKLRRQLRSKLLASPGEADKWDRYDMNKIAIIEERLQTVLKKMGVPLQEDDYQALLTGLLDDLLGFGPIQTLVDNKECSEIMVNGPDVVFAEYKGKLIETDVVFDDEDHIRWTAQRIVRPLMRSLDRKNPMVDARLPDGSRVHLVTEPSALLGTTITIRKFPEKRLTVEDLISYGSLTKSVADFFHACVMSRLNIVVAGGTGSGKTTLLNVLSSYIPEDERIVTVEDSAELQLAQRHVVRLETSPALPGTEDEGKLEIRDLVKGTLRMRPDRIVVGEVRSGEALDMLQAMNTGHDGSLTTVHANSPRDAVARLETLVLMAGMDLPVLVVRSQIAAAIDMFVQQARLKDGSRKVVQVTEVLGMEGDQITLMDLFLYQTPDQVNNGYSHEGGGELAPTGFPPGFLHRLEQYGFRLPKSIFGAGRSKFNR
ncbi:MAG: type II secretion system protein E [Anaerolineaceae bacterium]|nr:type II secretion system protein E [Anaerolineaceae bacterium]